MTTSKKPSSKTQRGGKRPGAGRPKKDRTPPAPIGGQLYETAEEFLEAVVRGEVVADPARIQAAKCLIRYQEVVRRIPKINPSPKKLEENERRSVESAIVQDFEKRAAEIRRRHAERLKEKNQ